MELNSALRVFWKAKQWNFKKETFESDQDLIRKARRKRARRQQKMAPRTPSDHEDPEELVYKPMLTFPCSMCQQEIDSAGTFLHKKQHNALGVLGLQWLGGKKPQSSMIVVQRQAVISGLLSSFTFSERVLQSINHAFELLWKKQPPAYYKIFNTVEQTSTYSPDICHLLIKGVAICGTGNSAWKVDMNDKFTVINNFGDKPNSCFLGLFDGHHGDTAADLVSKELPILLLQQLSRLDPSYQMSPEQQQLIQSFHTVFREEYVALEDVFSCTYKSINTHRWEYPDIHKAFAKAFWRMDRLLRLGRNEVSRVRWSGCSAATCILEGSIRDPYGHHIWTGNRYQYDNSSPFQWMPQIISGVLHIANVGNVQAVLCRNGKGFCLTKEHTTRNINERIRVLQRGAFISSKEPCGLLEGYNKTTRGLGFHGNLKLKRFIIPAPQTISVPIDDLCQFLILATNGLWEVLDKKEVTALVITLFQVYKEACASDTENKSPPSEKPLSPDSDIHVLFHYKPESEACMSTMDVMKKVSESLRPDACIYQPKHAETSPPEVTSNPCHLKETIRRPSRDGAQGSDKVPCAVKCAKSFYEGAAEFVSRELVNTALEGGSRDNITVMVIFLNESEYQLLM